MLDRGDTHNRVMSSLAIDGQPLSWLGFALRFDGRYDWHRIPGQGNDDGLVGDPRLYVRVDSRSIGSLRAGARFGLWLPGGNAPSLDLGAASPELCGTLTYAALGCRCGSPQTSGIASIEARARQPMPRA